MSQRTSDASSTGEGAPCLTKQMDGAGGAHPGLPAAAPVGRLYLDSRMPELSANRQGSAAGWIEGCPRHVAIIMDGNGRWARQRLLPRSAGHRQGVEAVRRAVRAALELGIDYLTIYSFSAENWSRPAAEISDLLGLFRRFIHRDVAKLHAAGVRIRVIGERCDLAPDICQLIDKAERLTAMNTTMTLVVAFNYGARQEIAGAVRRLAAQVEAGRLAPADITPETIAVMLDASDVPDPDLLIRTSGEQRLSNFLLWQCAYAEFVFVREHWPDFSREILERAVIEYRGRNRRFGGLPKAADVWQEA